MALNGRRLDAEDLATADRLAAEQGAFLDRFEADARAERMTPAQFAARAEQYAGAAWGPNLNARRAKVLRSGKYREERRVHAKPMGAHEPCATCEAESAKGWQPVGSLLPLGDAECRGNCDCFYEFK
jgi:hypothetical protein